MEAPASPTLNATSRAAGSSAVRDLLQQASRPGMISLAGGLPDHTLFPVAELGELTDRLLRCDGQQLLQYGETGGTSPYRQTLSAHFGVSPEAELLITTGSQQGLDLLARVLFEPRDVVVVGDPEYLGMLQVLRSHRAEPLPIPIDEDGLIVEVLEQRLTAGVRPKACYLVPHFHNPTGVTMSPERRRHLDGLVSRYGFVVVEDDPYRQLYFDSPPVDFDADPEWTVRLRSMSKTLAPGLRVGTLEASAQVREAITLAKQSTDLHTSTLCQAIAAEAIGESWYPGHLERIRATYDRKAQLLSRTLTEVLGDRVSFTGPNGGMFLWVDFGPSVDANRLLADAIDEGVCFVPGEAFAVSEDLRSHARLSFATASPEEIVEAVERLARLL